MQQSYISRKTISFPGSNYYIRPGDILVHDPGRNQITVYRDGSITKIIEHMTSGVSSMVGLKWLEDIKSSAKPPEEDSTVRPSVKAEPKKPPVKLSPTVKKKVKEAKNVSPIPEIL